MSKLRNSHIFMVIFGLWLKNFLETHVQKKSCWIIYLLVFYNKCTHFFLLTVYTFFCLFIFYFLLYFYFTQFTIYLNILHVLAQLFFKNPLLCFPVCFWRSSYLSGSVTQISPYLNLFFFLNLFFKIFFINKNKQKRNKKRKSYH